MQEECQREAGAEDGKGRESGRFPGKLPLWPEAGTIFDVT